MLDIYADSGLKLKCISLSLCVDFNLTVLHFSLLSLVQTTAQWSRIYCSFVFWEKTVAWEKSPKSAVWAPLPVPLTKQICCYRWALHLQDWPSLLRQRSDQICHCCTKPTRHAFSESGVDGKAAAESSELCLFCLEMSSISSKGASCDFFFYCSVVLYLYMEFLQKVLWSWVML